MYEWAGGREAFARWLNRFYDLVEGEAPEIAAMLSGEHRAHVTDWWVEVTGGPSAYTERRGSYEHILASHRNLAITAERDSRWGGRANLLSAARGAHDAGDSRCNRREATASRQPGAAAGISRVSIAGRARPISPKALAANARGSPLLSQPREKLPSDDHNGQRHEGDHGPAVIQTHGGSGSAPRRHVAHPQSGFDLNRNEEQQTE
jgi:truncated hemoglobin YjbI